MNNYFVTLTVIAATLLTTACTSNKTCNNNEQLQEYKPEWRSLANHHTPQWMMDLKFGLYSHWGPQSVMQEEGTSGSDALIDAFNRWTGDKFDAKEWARIFKDAGAQFGGPIAIHGSGCVNWDSEVTDWNSVNYGPKVDILGELSSAIRAEGMYTIATFHNVRKKGIWGQISKSDKTFIEPNYSDSLMRTQREWMEGWYDRVYEASTKYDLDIIWFDTSFGDTVGPELSGFLEDGHYTPNAKPDGGDMSTVGGISEEYQRRLIADYFNDAARKGREVEVMYKSNDIPYNIGMRDIENGNLNGQQYDPWVADINMMHHVAAWDWFYVKENPLKDANCLIDMLIDMTSKNGRLLLNVPPKADGSFPEAVTRELSKIGDWLRVNGEGIYGTTPWSIHGEGPTKIKIPGHHGHGKNGGQDMAAFTSEDLRYTTNNNCVYAFVLDTPKDSVVKFYALGSECKIYPGEIKKVSLLGSDEAIEWSHEENYLEVKLPSKLPCDFAYCIKVEL